MASIMRIGIVQCTLCALMIGSVQSFLSSRAPLALPRQSASASAIHASEPNPLFDSPGWESIKQELDHVPIFAVANEKGQPIKYRIEAKGSSVEIPLFYTHVSDALQELGKAKENTPLPGMDINPYPLGEIFELWAKDEAVIVPNKQSIVQAGAPPNANPIGQQVPLFACMEIAQENEDGKPVLPLFFELEDANNALKQAASFSGGKEEDLEVVGLNLPEAVNLLANVKEDTTAFQFIPPTSSLDHIRDYLSG